LGRERDGLLGIEVHRLHMMADVEDAAALGGLGPGLAGARRANGPGGGRGGSELQDVATADGRRALH
jgi:hypothetical protein